MADFIPQTDTQIFIGDLNASVTRGKQQLVSLLSASAMPFTKASPTLSLQNKIDTIGQPAAIAIIKTRDALVQIATGFGVTIDPKMFQCKDPDGTIKVVNLAGDGQSVVVSAEQST